MSGTQTLRWSCRETSWHMQDTQSWRDGPAAEDHSSLFSIPLRCFLLPQGTWSVIWPQHSIGPFHRESAQDILAFLTNLYMWGTFVVKLPLFYKDRGQAARAGQSSDLFLRAYTSLCSTALPCLFSLSSIVLSNLSNYRFKRLKEELWP